jgi:predicted permease
MIGSIRRFFQRLYSFFRHTRLDNEFDSEVAAHIELATEAHLGRGVPPDEARRQALIRFGGMAQMKEQHRETRSLPGFETLMQDLRYAFRMLRRDAASAAFAMLITALGIGGASTVFSVVNAMLLRPLPFRDPGRLVWITNGDDLTASQTEHYADLREENQSFSDLAGWSGFYRPGDRELLGAGEPERLTSVPVTETFFALLGVEPAIGRSFTKEECQGKYSAPPAMLLSHSFWRRRFASDPGIVGQKLILDNQPVIVAGVLPAWFDFASVFAPGIPVDIFIPWPLTDTGKPAGNTMKVIGRLKPGVTVQSAQAEFTVLAKQLEAQHPERNPIRPRLMPLQQHVSAEARPALVVLGCAVGVVMLIVCANLSSLQMARMGTRQKEMAIRAALGAGRSRLLRQMLTESVALACCGGMLGLIFAVAGTHELAHLGACNLALLESVRVDGSTLAFALLAAVGTGVLLGLAPALQVPAYKLRDGLQGAGRGSSGGKEHRWFRNGLVVCEVAFACILLVGASLLIQSFLRVLEVNPGFQPERAAALRIDPSFRIASPEQQNAFIDDVLHRTRSVPGIVSAGIADVLPLRDDRSWVVTAKGQVYAKKQQPEAFIRVVRDGYFEALGIALMSGREFTESDRAASEPVAMVNETLARTLWPGQDAIGQLVTTDGGRSVVGVVADVRHEALEKASGPELYLPMRQTGDYADMELVMRTALPPESLAGTMRAALRPVDPNLPVREFETLQALVDKAVSPRRFLVMLLAGFAGFALLLASLGIYALISHSVSQRTREIAICMALGASEGLVRRSVLTETLRLTVLGVALGTVASFVLTRGLESLLFGTTPADPVIFSAVTLLLCTVGLLAGYIPARRASRTDPMLALRAI